MNLEQEIKDKALKLGFDAAGIADASPLGAEHIEHFETWLQRGYAGRMEYMQRNLEKRTHPALLLAGAKSVVVVALNYKPLEEPVAGPPSRDLLGRVAQYAQYEDYHHFIRSRLHELAAFIRTRMDGAPRFKACVDSAPVAEKALAVRAGLGFIGKNHLLIHPRLGPQILLGELVTTAALRPDEPGRGACEGCDLCLRACPTGALRPDGFLDARRCISYLTQYERQDDRARDIGDWLFGCDECLLACPLRQNAPPRASRQFRHHADLATLRVHELLDITPESFEARCHDSPLRGPGLDRLKRNARLCRDNLSRRPATQAQGKSNHTGCSGRSE